MCLIASHYSHNPHDFEFHRHTIAPTRFEELYNRNQSIIEKTTLFVYFTNILDKVHHFTKKVINNWTLLTG